LFGQKVLSYRLNTVHSSWYSYLNGHELPGPEVILSVCIRLHWTNLQILGFFFFFWTAFKGTFLKEPPLHVPLHIYEYTKCCRAYIVIWWSDSAVIFKIQNYLDPELYIFAKIFEFYLVAQSLQKGGSVSLSEANDFFSANKNLCRYPNIKEASCSKFLKTTSAQPVGL
jgi:hypothetical protein